jgi:4-amino-4-deoxy-L-arabinose transferase-like glycosyltransferase
VSASAPAAPIPSRRLWRDCHFLLILAVALLLRLGFWWFGPAFSPDEEYYRPLALNLWRHHSFSLDGHTPDTYWAPLVPFITAPLFALDGGSGVLSHLLYVLLSVGVVALVYALADTVSDTSAARLSAWFAALYPWNILYSKSLNTQTLSVFLLTAGALYCARWLTPRPPACGRGFSPDAVAVPVHGSRFTVVSCLLTGLLFGLGTLASARTTVLLLCPLSIVLMRCPGLRHKAASAAALLGAWALLVAPWCVRNSLIVGRPQFTQTGGALNLWIGAVWSYYGEFYTGDRPDDARFAYFREHFPEGPARDQALMAAAKRYIFRDPWRFLRHQTRKWLWIDSSGHSIQTRRGPERTVALATAFVVNLALPLSLLALLYLTMCRWPSRRYLAFTWLWLAITYVTTIPWGAPNAYRFSNALDDLLLISLAIALTRPLLRRQP